MKTINSSERGQVLILLVVGIVALLGFTALAIDGGLVYSDRRFSQNASDSSSLAGGGKAALTMEDSGLVAWQWTSCDQANQAMSDAVTAAIDQAQDNDFVIDANTSDHNGAKAECAFVDYGSFVDKYIDVTTLISFTTDTSFVHFVYNGPVRNQVEAVTRVRPRNFMGYGNAIVAHREDCPNSNTGGVHFDGNSDVDVNGGGVFSNACMRGCGNPDVDVENGKIYFISDYQNCGGADLDPPPEQGPAPLPDYSFVVDPPNCSNLPDYGEVTSPSDLSPGKYSKIRLNNGTMNLAPGLYCLYGNVTINGGSFIGSGVTIYLESGNFDTSGNATVQLSAPSDDPDPYPALPGMLIFMADGNAGSVTLLGNTDSSYTGTVYAADPDSMVEIGGTGSVLETYQTQLIGGTVFIHGNAEIDITFDGEENYEVPAVIELYK
jgi:hypothetical protein